MNGQQAKPEPVMTPFTDISHIAGLMQEIRKSIANALELRLSCTNPIICVSHGLSGLISVSLSMTVGGHQSSINQLATSLIEA